MLKIVKCILILLLFISSMSSSCFAINPLNVFTDKEDKQIHALMSYVCTDIMQSEWEWEWWQSYLAIEAIGIAKEYIDTLTGGKWDYTDQRANRLGWLTYNIIHLEIKF